MAFALGGASWARAEGESRPVVVELFTSQGCSSCPAADKILADMSKQPDILALSWAVDYWDYLGWPDTFASRAHTLRQRAYNESIGRQVVYTPQMFIDGRMQIVGSRRSEVERAIEHHRKMITEKIPASLYKTEKGTWQLKIAAGAVKSPAAIRMIWFDREKSVTVRRGENSGKVLSYANIVRGSQVVGQYSGEAMTLDLMLDDAKAMQCDGLAVLVQPEGAGPVIAAATATW